MDDITPILRADSTAELPNCLGRLDDGRLEQVVIDLQTLVRVLDAALVHAVGELDRRVVPDGR